MPRRNDSDTTSSTFPNITKTVPVVLLPSLGPAKRAEYGKMDNFTLKLTITPPSLAPELRTQYQVVTDDDILRPGEDAQDSLQDEPDEPSEVSTSSEASEVDSMQDQYQQSTPSKRLRVTMEDQEYKSLAKAKRGRILTRSEGRQGKSYPKTQDTRDGTLNALKCDVVRSEALVNVIHYLMSRFWFLWSSVKSRN